MRIESVDHDSRTERIGCSAEPLPSVSEGSERRICSPGKGAQRSMWCIRSRQIEDARRHEIDERVLFYPGYPCLLVGAQVPHGAATERAMHAQFITNTHGIVDDAENEGVPDVRRFDALLQKVVEDLCLASVPPLQPNGSARPIHDGPLTYDHVPLAPSLAKRGQPHILGSCYK